MRVTPPICWARYSIFTIPIPAGALAASKPLPSSRIWNDCGVSTVCGIRRARYRGGGLLPGKSSREPLDEQLSERISVVMEVVGLEILGRDLGQKLHFHHTRMR